MSMVVTGVVVVVAGMVAVMSASGFLGIGRTQHQKGGGGNSKSQFLEHVSA